MAFMLDEQTEKPIRNPYESNGIFDCAFSRIAEQKARSTYEHLLDYIDDPDVADPIQFLREREVVHFQRFGESLRFVREYMESPRQFIMPKPDSMK